MKKQHTLFITQGALIAALYVVLTLLSNVFGLASGVIQFRLSEALCVLAAFTPAAIPGLAVGCFVSNMLTGCMIWDVILGSIATLIGAVVAYLLRRYPMLAPWPNVISNTVIVPFILRYVYGSEGTMWFFALTVGLGEIVTCGILGYAVVFFMKKHGDVLKIK